MTQLSAASSRRMIRKWFHAHDPSGMKARPHVMLLKWTERYIETGEMKLVKFDALNGEITRWHHNREWKLNAPAALNELAKLIEESK